MCPLGNIAMRDYQESMTTGQTYTDTDGQTDAGQIIPMCRYALQATQKGQTSRSRSLCKKFWYPWTGLTTRNAHVKYEIPTSSD